MQAATTEEAVLVQAPLRAVQARLADLLEEWPEHPVLTQLAAIAGRVLGMPVAAPLKQLLTGLELLLARAQVGGRAGGRAGGRRCMSRRAGRCAEQRRGLLYRRCGCTLRRATWLPHEVNRHIRSHLISIAM